MAAQAELLAFVPSYCRLEKADPWHRDGVECERRKCDCFGLGGTLTRGPKKIVLGAVVERYRDLIEPA